MHRIASIAGIIHTIRPSSSSEGGIIGAYNFGSNACHSGTTNERAASPATRGTHTPHAYRMQIFKLAQGSGPLVVSMPHIGTHLPDALATRLTDYARTLPDTDWHLDRLYDFLQPLDATVLQATHSRYVIDLNRPPDNASLYPGQDTTGLVPIDAGDRSRIYRDAPPDDAEIAARRDTYWQPYHDALASALQAAKARHGYALLWDAHSIKSILPRFFSGKLPDLNLGTADGASCGAGLGEALLGVANRHGAFTAVLNARYKGGYITRAYGQPQNDVHAAQLELSWATYMDEHHPFAFRDDLAGRIRPVLHALLTTLIDWGRSRYRR